MAIHPWPHLLKRLKKGQCLLGLDVGSKTLGIAYGAMAEALATPLVTLNRGKVATDLAALAKLAKERDAGGFVIGLPLNMDGSEGESAGRSRLFAKQILEHKALFSREPEISFFDERLSTAAMERFLIKDVDMSRARRAEVIDKLAAAHILQAAFDCVTKND